MRVLNDNVLVSIPSKSQTTKSGLYIPDIPQDGQVIYGTVVQVGPGKDGKEVPVKEGDTVWFAKFNASKLDVDGTEYYVVSEPLILLVK